MRPRQKCLRHPGQRLTTSRKLVSEHVLCDLQFSKSGCRKTVTKYVGPQARCDRCNRYYSPPAIRRIKGHFFGHTFKAWATYQRIVLRLPYRVISQAIEDQFREHVSGGAVVQFVSELAGQYTYTERQLLRRILSSPFVHVDETTLNLQGVDHYVWVLTDGSHVVFLVSETRETSLIQKLFGQLHRSLGYRFLCGVRCGTRRQQKCLVHLIRDLNDDLWKNPFNQEFEGFVGAVKELIGPVIEDVHRFGLKQRNLKKHERAVKRFYDKSVIERQYECEVTQKFQKRFLRYPDSLFRFLVEDGIPWNNNMGERAIRHLAVQRKISGSFFRRTAPHYLRLLAINQTRRFQQKYRFCVSFCQARRM